MLKINLTDLVSVDVLQELQDAFSEYSKMACIITDNNGVPITEGSGFSRLCAEYVQKYEKGGGNCGHYMKQAALSALKSEEAVIYSCHMGLMNYAVPIVLNRNFMGAFVGGQVLSGDTELFSSTTGHTEFACKFCKIESPCDCSFEELLRRKALEYDIDPDRISEAAGEIRYADREEIEKTAVFLKKTVAVFLKVAYQRYLMAQKNQIVEVDARTQSEFLARFADDIQKSITELFLLLSDDGEDRNTSMEPVRKQVDMLLARTMKLGAMVEDSADYANTMNGIFEINESVYDIRRIAELKLSEFISRAEEKNNGLSFIVEESVPRLLMGDATRISTIIGKLIENSIRYTENSTVQLRISAKNVSYSTILIISVADGGVGIEPKQAEYIKNYMSSRGFSDTRDEEFEMLGFSLIGYCVNAMSGTIDLRSSPGAGTEFVIRLPQLRVEGGKDE